MNRQFMRKKRLLGNLLSCVLLVVLTAGSTSAEGIRLDAVEQKDFGPGMIITDVKLNRSNQYTLGGITPEKHGYLATANQAGKILWSKDIGITEDDRQIQFTTAYAAEDGTFLLGGSKPGRNQHYANLYFAKIDSNGEVQWKRVIETEGSGVVKSVIPTSDGGLAYAAISSSNKVSVAYAGKINNDGQHVWMKELQSIESGSDGTTAESISGTTDGGYLVGGSRDGAYSVWKLNSAGEKEWDKSYEAASIGKTIASKDGGGIIAFSNNTGEIHLLRVDSAGQELTRNTLPSGTLNSLEPGKDGSFLVATSSGIYKYGSHSEVQGSAPITKVSRVFFANEKEWIVAASSNRVQRIPSEVLNKPTRSVIQRPAKQQEQVRLKFDSEEYSISRGDTFDTVVISESSKGQHVPVTKYSAFVSDKPEILNIDKDGNITGVKRGTAVIQAEYNGQIVTAEVRVY